MAPVPVVVYSMFKMAVGDTLPDFVIIALSLGLSVMAPITIWSNRFMIGYFNPIVYHSPTLIAVRLFVIPLTLLALRAFKVPRYRSLNHRMYFLLLSAAIVLVATLAKPNFTLVLLPACCLFGLYRVLRRQQVDFVLLLVGLCLPGFLLLGLQFLLIFTSREGESALAIGVLEFMKHWIPVWRIPIQLLLSLVFPIGVYALFFKRARRHVYLNMCWTVFAFSAAVSYSLYETGGRFTHGNFLWNSYSAIFALMFASSLFMLEQHVSESKQEVARITLFGVKLSKRVAIVAVLFNLHVLSGIAYYIRFMSDF